MEDTERNSLPPRKRRKIKQNLSVDRDVDENLNANILDSQTIREGMLLLGCVKIIKPTFVVMSLPGCLTGKVPINNISEPFTESLNNYYVNDESEEPSLFTVFEVGMTIPCKVIQVIRDLVSKVPDITLSINPQDVNANIRPSCLYLKMVLYTAIKSIEDHGYVVDVGAINVRGFVPTNNVQSTERLKIGQVIPTCIQKLTMLNKVSADVILSKLGFNEDFPEVTAENVNLIAILPGSKIKADIIDVKYPFVYMKYSNFDACGIFLQPGGANKALKVSSSVPGTVLYLDSFTHMIHLMLDSKPSPDCFASYFEKERYQIVENLNFQFMIKNRAYFKVGKRTYGFIKSSDLPRKNINSDQAFSFNHNVPKACVVSLHFMDNLVELSTKPSMIERKIILPQEVKVGDVYEAFVKEHKDGGMNVDICPGLRGFVRRIFMSDFLITKPALLFPVGSKVTCKVLSSDGRGKVLLTTKETLVNLENKHILSAYETLQKDKLFKGVIALKNESFFLILFFNDIQGYIPSYAMPNVPSNYFVGQTVSCQVLKYNIPKRRLVVMIENDAVSPQPLNINLSVKEPSHPPLTPSDDIGNNEIEENSQKYDPRLLMDASIIYVNDHEIGLRLDQEDLGRVHITELGWKNEGQYPMKKYKKEQTIKVHVIGEYKKKDWNFLEISHRRWTVYMECSLDYPVPVPLYQYFNVGDSVLGFIKQVNEERATVSLTPFVSGVLEFLHYAKSVKVLRKLSRQLKVGRCVRATVIHPGGFRVEDCGKKPLTLSKMEVTKPSIGENIVGLVQVASFDEGIKLKLPFDYHGSVSITDVSDDYSKVKSLLMNLVKLRFVLCHVLDVDHTTKYCSLSLRMSRLFKKTSNKNDIVLCKEISDDTVKEGDHIKGFVKRVFPQTVVIEFGRGLEGKANLHPCSCENCTDSTVVKDFKKTCVPGNIVEVVVEKVFPEENEEFMLAFIQLKEQMKMHKKRKRTSLVHKKKDNRLPVHKELKKNSLVHKRGNNRLPVHKEGKKTSLVCKEKDSRLPVHKEWKKTSLVCKEKDSRLPVHKEEKTSLKLLPLGFSWDEME